MDLLSWLAQLQQGTPPNSVPQAPQPDPLLLRQQAAEEALARQSRKDGFEFNASSTLKGLPYNPAHPRVPGVDFWKELGFPSPMMQPGENMGFRTPHNEAMLPSSPVAMASSDPAASPDPVALAMVRLSDPQNRPLAAAEHGAFADQVVQQYGPLGMLMLLGAVPGYQAAKFAAQNLPGGGLLDQASRATTGLPLAGPNVTAPGLDQLGAGLRPLLNWLPRRPQQQGPLTPGGIRG